MNFTLTHISEFILHMNTTFPVLLFLSEQDFKDFIDAESIMPLPTSDLRQPILLEMKTIKANKDMYAGYSDNMLSAYEMSNVAGTSIPAEYTAESYKTRREKFHEHNRDYNVTTTELPSRPSSEPIKTTSAGNGEPKNDMGSVDSSDTYASCNTHPFLSEGDLTSDIVDQSCSIVDYVLDSNLYVNPLDVSTGEVRGIKKSASGDTALRNLGVSPMEESLTNFACAPERGSRGSLNDSPIPKHRKTRFQQVRIYILDRDAKGKTGERER